jgi:4,5-dihydroxyphthalate decarboxylase
LNAPTDLALSAAFVSGDRTDPLMTGEVKPVGIRLYASALYPTEIFWRQLHHAEFDVSDMSLSSYTIAVSKGATEWVGIPAFTFRRFFHTGVMIRVDRGIEKPADLAGKKVGVPEFQQTSALWTRGILRTEFGVDPLSMEWFMERNPGQSHGSATGFVPPPGLRLNYVPREKSIGRMLVDGDLDALIHFSPGNNIIDRTTVDPLSSPMVRRLFDPPRAEAKRYYAKTGIYPINHCIVVRRSIAEKYPWVILNLYSAFREVKTRLDSELDRLLEPFVSTGLIDGPTIGTLHRDTMPYSINASKATLDALIDYLHTDGLIDRRVRMDELFAEQTLDL